MLGDLLQYYRLHSDDFAYVSASRTLPRALASLFVPHNTHVVPAWRLLTWGLVAAAGRLANLQVTFAGAAYASLTATMLLMGRLVARETGRPLLGFAAMVATGSTAMMTASATWYSASQALWAGFGILATLWYLQGFRRSGGRVHLVMAALSCWLAGGFWSIGHAAGPIGTIYLFAAGGARCRRVAWVPLAATALAVALAFAFGGQRINRTESFGGRTTLEAAHPVQGLLYTMQAIPEDLIFGNLGLNCATTAAQGAVLTLGLAACWAASVLRRRPANCLELAGGALFVSSFLVEWTVRGYESYTYLRGAVPWYDTIPHLGFVLFLAGWCAGSGESRPAAKSVPLATGTALAVLLFQAALITLNQPRVDAVLQKRMLPKIIPEELARYHIPPTRLLYVLYAQAYSAWQQRTWQRLDQAEGIARRAGIGRAQIDRAYDRLLIPDPLDDAATKLWKHVYLPGEYEVANMLELPSNGTETDLRRVHRALDLYLIPEPNPVSDEDVLDFLRGLGVPLPEKGERAGQDTARGK
jgi:hypothetical protein